MEWYCAADLLLVWKPNPEHEVPEDIGLGLMRHCHSEFTYLAKALPSLYYGDATNPRPQDNW